MHEALFSPPRTYIENVAINSFISNVSLAQGSIATDFFCLFSLIFFMTQGSNFLCYRATQMLQDQGKRNLSF